MHKIINMDIEVSFNFKNENNFSVYFRNLEIELENKLFILTSNEDRSFNYDLEKGQIIEKNKLFSFMNEKEYFTSPQILLFGENKILLEKEINNHIKEYEKISNVPTDESKRFIKDLEKNNKKNLNELYFKLIDISLDENDIELFEVLIKQKKKFLKG